MQKQLIFLLIIINSIYSFSSGIDLGIMGSTAVSNTSFHSYLNPAFLATQEESSLSILSNESKTDYIYSWNLKLKNMSILKDSESLKYSYGIKLFKDFYLGNGFSKYEKIDRRFDEGWYTSLGLLYRPSNFLSLGMTAENMEVKKLYKGTKDGLLTFGIGLRPFKNEKIEMYSDIVTTEYFSDISWKMGVNTEIFNGFHFDGEYYSNDKYRLGFSIDFLNTNMGVTSSIFDSNNYYTNVSVGSIWKENDFFDKMYDTKEIELTGTILSQKVPGNFGVLYGNTISDYLVLLKQIEKRNHIKKIYIKINNFYASSSYLEEIRNQLIKLKKIGKKIYIHMDYLTFKNYYLASVADELVLSPRSHAELIGFHISVPFYKEFLDKIGVEYEYERIGKYKSAVEHTTKNNISDEYKSQLIDYIDSQYKVYIEDIAKSRNVKKEVVKSWLKQGFYSSEEAQKNKIVDSIEYRDEMYNKHNLNSVVPLLPLGKTNNNWKSNKKIVVLNLAGAIIKGETVYNNMPLIGGKFMGSDTINRIVEGILKNRDVVSVVVRIDSPGGSIVGSEQISRGLERLQNAGIPVIVSMGSVAASGGYYVSTIADRIFADKNSLTGSIGIYSMKLSLENLFSKLGINTFDYKTDELADIYSVNEDWTKEQREMVKKSLDYYYNNFIELVSNTRGIEKDKVDKLGRGRIYTGEDALKNGLIDEIGGLLDAVDYAKEDANIKNEYELVFINDLYFDGNNLLENSLFFNSNEQLKHSLMLRSSRGSYMLPLEIQQLIE